jgi:hypothetical protein
MDPPDEHKNKQITNLYLFIWPRPFILGLVGLAALRGRLVEDQLRWLGVADRHFCTELIIVKIGV